jgi:hypothetical protein
MPMAIYETVLFMSVAIMNISTIIHHDLVRDFSSSKLTAGFIFPVINNPSETSIRMAKINNDTITISLL